MQIIKFIVPVILLSGFIFSCKKDKEDDTIVPAAPQLIFKFKFDSTQVRLDGSGDTVTILPAGHGAQSPVFNSMSAHYIELAQSANTWLGTGAVLYHAPETTAGSDTAIDFSKSAVKAGGETFFSVPLSNVQAGSYQYLRVSLAYQNYNIKVRSSGFDLTGTIASFIGYNTYIGSVKVKDNLLPVNANKLQGFWAFEFTPPGSSAQIISGQGAGVTTVPNPLFLTSPIPQGSCVVTGAFASPLTITGSETQDVVVTVSLSTNKSFEWKENSTAGYYEPANGDTVVDMGIRGLIPIVQ